MSMKPDAPYYRSQAFGRPGVRLMLAGHECYVRVYQHRRVIVDDMHCCHDIQGPRTRRQLEDTMAVYYDEVDR